MTQPAQLGRYDVVAEIGRGAMGVVYRAVDPMLERTVAIKTINMALDPGEMEHYEKRFTIEARAAGGLNHPNIVIIYDIGRSGDLAYMAMEYLEGRELKELITGGEITPERALDITALVADGLAYAHAAREEGDRATPMPLDSRQRHPPVERALLGDAECRTQFFCL